VPRVVGKKLAQAKKAIRRHRCTVGKVRHKWSRKFTKNTVISQRPHGGAVLAHNGRVNLVVSIGKCHDDGDHDLDDRCPPVAEHNRP
jgi:beta-lactam-binding protein with PASTA domain